ncbi:MAG: hypothetical protein RLP02_27145, partial [Coleofasciculus sp. C2-GNP5-27]
MRSRNRNKELREVVVTKSASNRIIEEEAREKSQNKDRIYIQGGVGLAALMVIASLSLYAFPDMFKPGEQIAEEQNILLLEE